MSLNNRVVFLSIFGTIIEWMDYTLYGYLANTIALEFFPQSQLQERLLWVFGVFASGFLLRPIGAILFGHYADKQGRKKAIILTIFITGVTTLLMGLLPGYREWGLATTFILLLLRITQSLAIAGENGVTVFLLEHTHKNQNFYGSLVGTASNIGMFISVFLVMIFTSEHLPTWSWRLPYIIGGLLCFIICIMRYSIDETPQFRQIAVTSKIQKIPLFVALKKHPISFTVTVIYAGFIGLYLYICGIYYHSYLISDNILTQHQSAVATTYGQIIAVLALPFSGIVADRIGKDIVLNIGLMSAIITAPLMFIFANTHLISLIYLAMTLYGIVMGLAIAPMFKTLFDLFPTQVRYSGYISAWNISVAFFGGTAPLIAQWLAYHHLPNIAGYYVSLSAIIALVVSIRLGIIEKFNRNRFRISI